MFKAAFYLSAFYLIYWLLLSRDTSYVRNRAFILISLIFAMTLPCFSLQAFKPINIQFFGKFLSDVFITASSSASEKISMGSSVPCYLQVFYSIYVAGVIVFLLKLVVDLLNLLFLILKQRDKGSRIIRYHGFNTAGFSAMGHIFINSRLNSEESTEIIKHEQNHLKNNHFIDIIFIEITKAFQWFNPAVYLFNRSLRAIHEYQADQECLNSGIPVVTYQSLLFNQLFRTGRFNLTNSFSNPSLIKKRMVMMTRKRTPAVADMKLLIVIPVIGLLFLFLSAFREVNNTSVNKTDNAIFSDETPYTIVDEMPVFPGGDEALIKYIGANVQYPSAAKDNNIQGKIIVRFSITSKGEIRNVSVLKGLSTELDNEAMRVIKTLPSFIPGKVNGKPVSVWYMIPITFTLR